MCFTKSIEKDGVIPVLAFENETDVIPVAAALLKGGVHTMEITFRTPVAPSCIRKIRDTCPQIIVGAGTITNLQQCHTALEAGAQFIVCPGFDAAIIQECQKRKIPVVPGCVTPTEIMQAISLGIDIIKFFPANDYGGLNTMKALVGPFGNIRFIPTGGINENNLCDYLKAPFVAAVGGSWLCTGQLIREGRFPQITENCRHAMAIVQDVRQNNHA